MKTEKKDWFLFSIICLGMSIVAFGLIFTLASNWQSIPDIFKIITGLGINLGLIFGIYRSKKRNKPRLFEGLILLFNIFLLAYMGLLTDIFNLNIDGHYLILTWSLITSYTIFISKKLINNLFWLVLVLTTLGDVFLKSNYHFLTITPVLYFLTTAALSSTDKFPKLRAASEICSFIVILFFMPKLSYHLNFESIEVSFIYYLLVLSCFILLALFSKYSRIQKIILSSALTIFVLLGLPLAIWKITLVTLFFELCILSLIAVLMALKNYRRRFNFVLFLICLKIIFTYAVLVKGLLATGLGLTGLGLLILGFAYLLYKKQDSLISYIKSLDQKVS